MNKKMLRREHRLDKAEAKLFTTKLRERLDLQQKDRRAAVRAMAIAGECMDYLSEVVEYGHVVNFDQCHHVIINMRGAIDTMSKGAHGNVLEVEIYQTIHDCLKAIEDFKPFYMDLMLDFELQRRIR